MSRAFVLPDLGEGLVEAEIVGVLVHEGDVIKEDAPLLEVETDKARVEIPSPMAGRVEKIHVRPGETVRVGAVLVTFSDGAATTSAPAPRAPDSEPRARAARPEDGGSRPDAPRDGASPSAGGPDVGAARDGGPVPATPATRRLARELGVDLRTVRP